LILESREGRIKDLAERTRGETTAQIVGVNIPFHRLG